MVLRRGLVEGFSSGKRFSGGFLGGFSERSFGRVPNKNCSVKFSGLPLDRDLLQGGDLSFLMLAVFPMFLGGLALQVQGSEGV